VSSGNHGKAASYMAKKLGVKARICASKVMPASKCQVIKDLGAELAVVGKGV